MKVKKVDFKKWHEYDDETLLEVINHGRSDDKKIVIKNDASREAFHSLLEEYNANVGWTAFSPGDLAGVKSAIKTAFKGIGIELTKLWPITKYLAKGLTGLATSVFTPISKSYWEEIKNEQNEEIKKISKKNEAILEKIQDDIMDNDFALITAMANPGYFLAAKVAQKILSEKEPKTARSTSSGNNAAAGILGGAAAGAALSENELKRELQSILAGAASSNKFSEEFLKRNNKLISAIQNKLKPDIENSSFFTSLNKPEEFKRIYEKTKNEISQQAEEINRAKDLDTLKKIIKNPSAIEEIKNKLKAEVGKISKDKDNIGKIDKIETEKLLNAIKISLLDALMKNLRNQKFEGLDEVGKQDLKKEFSNLEKIITAFKNAAKAKI